MNEFNYEGWVGSDFVTMADAAPSSSTDTGTKNQIFIDTDYIYVCIDTDTWKRVALSTF